MTRDKMLKEVGDIVNRSLSDSGIFKALNDVDEKLDEASHLCTEKCKCEEVDENNEDDGQKT